MCRVLKTALLAGFLFFGWGLTLDGGCSADQHRGSPSVLRFGHICVEDPAVTLCKYKPLMDTLSKVTGHRLVLVQKKNYKKMNQAFIRREVDLGILNSFSYVRLAPKGIVIPVCRRIIGKKNGNYQSYLIVRRDSHIDTYDEIRNKIFAFSDPNSTTGHLLPRMMLANHDILPGQDLFKSIFIGKHDSILYAVLNRTADVGAVASYIFENCDQRIKDGLKILDKSLPIPLGPLVVLAGVSQTLTEKIQQTLLSLNTNETGRKVLAHAGLDGFEIALDQDYDMVRKMASSLSILEGFKP